MLAALADEKRTEEFPNISAALPEMGKEAVRAVDSIAVNGQLSL